MALVVKDRVQETSTTTGTGTFTLAGAVSGFQSFSVIGNANTTYYAIVGGTEWEVGLGTYTSSGTLLSRDTILESSNGGTAVNFSAGTKNVFVTYPAEEAVYQDAIGTAYAPQFAASKVAQLKPVTYKWKIDGSDGQGFIAHELAEVVPDCVVGEKDATKQEQYEITPAVKDEQGNILTPAEMGTRTVPVYQMVDTSFLVATLTAAIQEQQTIINDLKARIETLETK
jgi:hypothetical protein